MASITERPDGRWRARYRDNDGKEIAHHFGRKVDAQRWLDEVASAVVTGSYVDPKASRITVAAWVEIWLGAQGHLKPSTRARYEGIVRRHILPRWGKSPLSAVTHADVIAWLAQISANGAAGATVQYVHRVASLVFELAVKDGRLAKNPARGVRLPRAATPEKRFLTDVQTDELADAAGDYRADPRARLYRPPVGRARSDPDATRRPHAPAYRNRGVGDRGRGPAHMGHA
jgi:hypothetical protein